MNTKDRRDAYDAVRKALDEPYGVRGDGCVSRKTITDAQDALNRIAYNHGWVSGEKDHFRARALRAEKWLRFIADKQHQFLGTIQIQMSEEEWEVFAEALDITPRTQSQQLSLETNEEDE